MKFPGTHFIDVTDVMQVIILQKCHFLFFFYLISIILSQWKMKCRRFVDLMSNFKKNTL